MIFIMQLNNVCQMYDMNLSIFEAIHSNEPKWAPGNYRGLEVRWEVLRCETTVQIVYIWLEFFRQFLRQCQKVTQAERLK